MLQHCPMYLRFHLGAPLHQLIVPIFLFIDMYYRVEWFDLHTALGHSMLGFFFGGE